MAFERSQFAPFHTFLQAVFRDRHDEERAQAQNFLLEERLAHPREDAYRNDLAAPADLADWQDQHDNYVYRRVYVDSRGRPETFTAANAANCLGRLDEDQYIVRLEEITAMTSRTVYAERPEGEIAALIDRAIADPADEDAQALAADLLGQYNERRDQRPIFAGFWGEVKDLFAGDSANWANALRDRFGMGHYAPLLPEDEIAVVLLRYRVSEVYAAAGRKATRVFAAPTVLDSRLSPFFCPTPVGWSEGQTVNLTAASEADYAFNCEILHRHLRYEPAHLYRTGRISQPPGLSCAEARRIHLAYIGDDFKQARYAPFASGAGRP